MNGKQLKNSILQWAIQGKLVPQDPNDEPASVLLERIRAEKKRLIKEGKIKKDKNESFIYRGDDNSYYEKFVDGRIVCIDDEIPFQIPQSWEWVRIGCIYNHSSGKQQSASNKSVGTLRKYITTSNLYWGYFVLNKVKEMFFSDEELESCSAKAGDLLVCEGGAGYGRSAIWDKDYDICLQNHVHRLRPIVRGVCEYTLFYIYLLKESGQLESVGTAMPGLSANRLKSILIPFPPLSEQKRIVAKLNRSIPFIERYGQFQEKLDDLNDSLLNNLKKSILQQAIQGKLVPQDPNDEFASSLLNRIQDEKFKMLAEGRLKKKNILDSVIYKGEDNKYYEKVGDKVLDISDEIPFEKPSKWEWCRLGTLMAVISDGTHKTPTYLDSGIPFLSVQNISSGELDTHKLKFISKQEHQQLCLRVKPQKDDILICRIGTLGKALKVYWDFEFSIFVSLGLLRPVVSETVDYIVLYINSPMGYRWIQNNKVGGGTHTFKLNLTDLPNMLICIPPINEQKRIVERMSVIASTMRK